MALQVSAAKDLSLFVYLKVMHIGQYFLDGGSRSHNGFVYAREGKDREAADICTSMTEVGFELTILIFQGRR
jgi:hypothetical protein